MTLSDELLAKWNRGGSLDEPLSRLVVATAARAAGCWRLEDGHLRLIGFGWASDMPDEVSQGFQRATRRVSLDQAGLGIVKAAVTDKPAIGRRDANATGLDGSASWIVKFGANTSLAVPIRDHRNHDHSAHDHSAHDHSAHDHSAHRVIGVIAVSTAAFVEEGDLLWQTLIQLSNQLETPAQK